MAGGKYEYGNSKCRLQWDNLGFIEVLNQDALAEVCLDAAEEIASKAGKNYTPSKWYSHKIGKLKGGRVAAIVYSNHDGDVEEATKKSLSRAVSACRC